MTDVLPLKPPILCVDDDPVILESLEPHLRKIFRVLKATSGEEALEVLEREPRIAVILSDMRMPGMSGAEFLSHARQRHPDATRMLLTGYADVESASLAVNEGQVFRFLTKPCPPDRLIPACLAALEIHQLRTAERELLEDTLRGSIQALVDVLALVHPVAFGRATRIREHVRMLSQDCCMDGAWYIEVAAMMSQLGTIALSESTLEKLYYGHTLDEEGEHEFGRMPLVLRQVLKDIPRLGPVVEVVDDFYRSMMEDAPPSTPGGHMLRMAVDFDVLQARGVSVQEAVDTMWGRTLYDSALLNTFAQRLGFTVSHQRILELEFAALRVGLHLADDLYTEDGALVAPRGYTISASFLARVDSFRNAGVPEPIRVFVPEDLPAALEPAVATA